MFTPSKIIKNLFLFFQFCFSFAYCGEIHFEVARGNEIQEYTNDLVRLSDAFYSKYPYLFEGSQSDDEFYLRHFANKADGWMIMAFDGNDPIGYAVGAPLNSFSIGQEPITTSEYDVNSLYLLGEITLLEPYRGRHLGREMIQKMEQFVKDHIHLPILCLTHIDEEYVATPKPDHYRSSYGFWSSVGFEARPDLAFSIDWIHVNELQESNHRMFYWFKPL